MRLTHTELLNFIISIEQKQNEILNRLSNFALPVPQDHWMNVDELIAYHPGHPKKETVYLWVLKKKIPYHKFSKVLAFRKSEIDAWLLESSQKKLSGKKIAA